MHRRGSRRRNFRGRVEGFSMKCHPASLRGPAPPGTHGQRSSAGRQRRSLWLRKTRLAQPRLTLHATDSTMLSRVAMGQTVSHLPSIERPLVNNHWQRKLCRAVTESNFQRSLEPLQECAAFRRTMSSKSAFLHQASWSTQKGQRSPMQLKRVPETEVRRLSGGQYEQKELGR